MPRHRRFVIAAITVGLGAAASAQDSRDERRPDEALDDAPRSIDTPGDPSDVRGERSRRGTVELRVGMGAGDLRATDLIGTAIFARNGDQLGEVDDLVLSADEGRIYAVLAIGGLLGIGQRLICVPLDVLEIRRRGAEGAGARVLVLPVSPEELQEWPVFRYEVAQNGARPHLKGHVPANPRGARYGDRMS